MVRRHRCRVECEHPIQERPRRRRSELERLVDLTVLGPTHPELGTCWLFTGTTTPYGRIAKAQDSYTHRLGWKLLRGPIPEGKELSSPLRRPACWNPEHLEPVTHAENQLHLRKTHCKHGHPLSGDNLRISPNGTRACRACNAAAQRAFRERSASARLGIGRSRLEVGDSGSRRCHLVRRLAPSADRRRPAPAEAPSVMGQGGRTPVPVTTLWSGRSRCRSDRCSPPPRCVPPENWPLPHRPVHLPGPSQTSHRSDGDALANTPAERVVDDLGVPAPRALPTRFRQRPSSRHLGPETLNHRLGRASRAGTTTRTAIPGPDAAQREQPGADHGPSGRVHAQLQPDREGDHGCSEDDEVQVLHPAAGSGPSATSGWATKLCPVAAAPVRRRPPQRRRDRGCLRRPGRRGPGAVAGLGRSPPPPVARPAAAPQRRRQDLDWTLASRAGCSRLSSLGTLSRFAAWPGRADWPGCQSAGAMLRFTRNRLSGS